MRRLAFVLWVAVVAGGSACSKDRPEDGLPMPPLPEFRPGGPSRPPIPPQAPLPRYEQIVPAGQQQAAPAPTTDGGPAPKPK